MAIYAIGDIQGCHDTLQQLLAAIRFAPGQDRLWLVGDLVNRGPRSLEVLRWARRLDDRVTAVLGNHDLHLLARHARVTSAKKQDTLAQVLTAPDAVELIDWLRHRPLVHCEAGHLMVHAGLLPAWSAAEAEQLARDAEAALRGPDWAAFLQRRKGERPPWSNDLAGEARCHAFLDVAVRIRTCRPDGTPEPDYSGPPDQAPPGCRPWFALRGPRPGEPCILFGHWAALGLVLAERHIALDTGCVWGGSLTAVRLDDRAVFQVPAVEPRRF
jgi:bis(5'-nucleosyl)-tetraphosphatase (symmetrical)